jgi:hypothetical protein
MDQFLYMVLVVFGFVFVAVLLINIRHFMTGKEFRGTCATNNPLIRDQFGECTVCGSKTGESCKQPKTD